MTFWIKMGFDWSPASPYPHWIRPCWLYRSEKTKLPKAFLTENLRLISSSINIIDTRKTTLHLYNILPLSSLCDSQPGKKGLYVICGHRSPQITQRNRTITKTHLFKYTENFASKNWEFSDKNSDIFHIIAQNIDCGYSLEPPRRGGSNEYPQSMFWANIRK